MRKSEMFVLGMMVLSIVIAVYVYPLLPEKMASHWNFQGEVNGYMPKFWGLSILPIMLILIFLLFTAIPKIDPLKANIIEFRKYYDWFVVLMTVFLTWLYFYTIIWNLGVKFQINVAMMPPMAMLFYSIGILCENSKRNWFIGIRTPWTLSSDNVWKKTHKIGGKLFKIAAIVTLGGLIFQKYSIFFVIMPIFLVVIYVVIYSYIEYKKEMKK